MRVVATFHQPSSVVQSLKCRLTPDDSVEHLVVAKVNRLEVFSLQPEGIRRECVLEIWGRVVALRSVPVEDSGISNILVLTDHPEPKLIVLKYVADSAGASLVTTGDLSVHDRYGRQSEFVTDVLVDPTGQVAVISCYVGKLKVIQFDDGGISNQFDVSVPEFYILALTFLHTSPGTYAIGILHYDHEQRLQLLSRDLDLENLELSAAPSTILPITVLSVSTFPSMDTPPLLIPVPPYTQEGTEDDFGTHLGGVLVVGGRKIIFYEHASQERRDIKRDKQRRSAKRKASAVQADAQKATEKDKEREGRKLKPKISVKWPWSEVTAWSPIDEEGRRFLIGDAYGRLAMVAFDDTPGLILVPLGETSPPVSLTYLSSQVVYLGSHFGESQLLRIHSSPFANADTETLPIPSGITTVSSSSLMSSKGKEKAYLCMDDERAVKGGRVVSTKGTFVEVLENFQNIAPIMDAVLADLDGSGQPQIVTCSGGLSTGAIKVVRTGADFQELGIVEDVPHVTNLWPLRTQFEATSDTHIVASTLRETYVFRLDAHDAIIRLDPSADGFVGTSPTLAVRNIPRRVTTTNTGRSTSSYVDSSLVVQVTPEKVHLVNYDQALGLFSVVGTGWDPNSAHPAHRQRSIVAADLNASQFVVGLSGGRLVLLNLGESDQFQELKSISAISCAPFDPARKYSLHIAVSFWGTNKIAILSLESSQTYMTTICETSTLTALPRSLLLYNFGCGRGRKDADYHPHIVAGLSDGTVMSFSLKVNELKDRKVFPLGAAPVSLSTCVVDGRMAVFASGSRASVLFWERQRLHHSPVMLKDAVRGTSLNSTFFPSCVVLATSSSLLIGNVRGVDKMQIRSIPLGVENPRRIAHHPSLKVFGVACNRTNPPRIGDFEGTVSCFKILDDVSFDQLSQFVCELGEEVTAVLALPRRENQSFPCFCVGIVELEMGEREPSKGRIVMFSLGSRDGGISSANPALRLISSEHTRGCVYQLVSVEDKIVAAVNTSVVLYKIDNTDGSASLRKLTEWNHNYFVTSLVAHDTTLIVGDAISSVSILNVVGEGLQSIARDYGPLWPVAVEAIGNSGVIGANSDCNLFTFSLQRNGNRFMLERDGSYHVDDVINKFLPGGLTSGEWSGNQVLKPEQLFFASSGRIGVILELSDEISLHMTALQRNMATAIVGPGEMHHTKWRAPANLRGASDAESSFGFLDGDFIEQFLTHPNPSELLEGKMEAERITLPQPEIRDVLEKLQSLH
ncbi:mono-functional DNA-alkylating methyl methanesulfonate N-term-domain-containing protein [Sparassis latifolia]